VRAPHGRIDASANPLIDRYSCVVSAGRWVITASSEQDRDVSQQIAGQYLMLAGK
jgi:hypothetical protein